jgi:hypothetical protein
MNNNKKFELCVGNLFLREKPQNNKNKFEEEGLNNTKNYSSSRRFFFI